MKRPRRASIRQPFFRIDFDPACFVRREITAGWPPLIASGMLAAYSEHGVGRGRRRWAGKSG
jgi:hypothetical protein